MHSTLFNDRRTTGLLDRVRQDVSNLRDDIGSLLSHTTKETLPNSARELADQAKGRVLAGGAYAASRLRHLRHQAPPPSASWIGGAILLGIVGYGIYALCRHNCASQEPEYRDDSEGGAAL